MRMHLMNIYVDDQEKALKFYTDVLGFQKKFDFPGDYRWLTVVSSEQPDGPELHLAPNQNPAAKTYQQSMYEQDQPAIMFYVDDVQAEYDRLTKLGVKFTLAPTKTTGSEIVKLDDTCGNIIQLTHLTWGN